MPHDPVVDSPETDHLAQDSRQSNMIAGTSAVGQEGDANLSLDRIESKIRRAQAILAGRLRPEPMVPTRDVIATLERMEQEFKGFEPPVTEEAKQREIDWLNLQAHYGGRPVVSFTTPEGVLTVLACGEEEIAALLKSLSPEDTAKLGIEYPPLPIVFNEPSPAASLTPSA